MVRQTIQKTAWLAKQFNRSGGLWRSHIQNAGKALNTHPASTYNWPCTLPTPVSDTIFFSPETYTQARISIPLLPQYMQLSPSNLIRPILLFTLFQSFTPLLPAMQGRCNHWKGALNLWVLHSPVGYNLVLPSSSLTVFALLSLNSLRPREDMFFTGRHVTDILFISGITNVKW